MKNKLNKKLIYMLSAGAAIAAPVVAVVSCGSKGKITTVGQDNASLVNKNNEFDKQNAQKHIDEINKLIVDTATAKAAPTVTLPAGKTQADFLPSQITKESLHLVPVAQLHVAVTSVTANDAAGTLAVNVNVESAVANDGTTPKTYTVELSGFATTATKAPQSQADADAAAAQLKAAADAKIAAANAEIVRLANAKDFTPAIKDGAATKTASKALSSDFTTKTYEGENGIKAEVISSVVSTTTTDGTVATVTVRISSSVAGTTPKTYTVDVHGFTLQSTFEAAHGLKSTAAANNPIGFNEINADGVSWNRGIVWHAQSQGMSFLMNLAKELGWHTQNDNIVIPPEVATTSGTVDGFTDGQNSDHLDVEQKIQDAIWTSQTTTIFSMTIHNPLTKLGMTGEFWKLNSNKPSAAQVVSAKSVASQAIIDGTHKETQIPTGTDLTSATAVQKVMVDFFKTNPWGAAAHAGAKQIVFDVKDDKIEFWLADLAKDPAAQAKALHDGATHVKAITDQVAYQSTSPRAEYMIDPSGSDGSMAPAYLAELGFNLSALGAYSSDGKFADGVRVSHYASYIDAENPGKIIGKMWITYNGNTFSQAFSTDTHAIRTYTIANEAELASLKASVAAAIVNVKNMSASTFGMLDTISGVVNGDFISMMKFIYDKNHSFSVDQISSAIDKLNNGSHHIEAVDGFLRGFTGIPAGEAPQSGSTVYTKNGAIVGLASMHQVLDLQNWFHYTKDHHSYVKSAPASPVDVIYNN